MNQETGCTNFLPNPAQLHTALISEISFLPSNQGLAFQVLVWVFYTGRQGTSNSLHTDFHTFAGNKADFARGSLHPSSLAI